MNNPQRLSPSYSLTLRIEYPNSVGMLGRVTSAIGENGGDIGAVDIVHTDRAIITRDITFVAIDREHANTIITAVRAIPEIDIVSVSDRTFLSHLGGKLEINGRVSVKSRDDLSMIYVPGVTRIAEAILENPDDAWNLSIKKNTVAVISDGSELLGLGNAGPSAALPVMESKALLFKEFAGVDAFPLCLNVANIDEFVAAVKAIAPTFGAIHLEDIGLPQCFEIEKRLSQELDIAVLHNDQHGTAIVVLAALMNALKLVAKSAADLRVVINGTGAAGTATARLLMQWGVRDVIVCQQTGGQTLHAGRVNEAEFEGLDDLRALASETNPRNIEGDLKAALVEADVFIGFGRKQLLHSDDLKAMNENAIIFMMAYPEPEVSIAEASKIARIVATGRSDFPNQINNMLCFPGFFRGLLDARATGVTQEMKLAAARAIADLVARDELNDDYIIPSVFNRRVARAVATAVVASAGDSGMARGPVRG